MTIRNFTSPEGFELGAKLAEWCDDAEPRARLKVPELPTRCASCAFRKGPHLASGSPATQMDALKCVIEEETFGCHDVHREGAACAGWMMMVLGNEDRPGKAPWDFVGGIDVAQAGTGPDPATATNDTAKGLDKPCPTSHLT